MFKWLNKNKIFDNPVWCGFLLVTLIEDLWNAKGYHHISKSILSTFLICLGVYVALYILNLAFKWRAAKITKMDLILFLLIFVVIAIELPVYIFLVHLPW